MALHGVCHTPAEGLSLSYSWAPPPRTDSGGLAVCACADEGEVVVVVQICLEADPRLGPLPTWLPAI